MLRISGEGWGYLQTPTSHEDYHLVLEYKWGERTWGRRADRARDAGVFVHCHDRFGDWPKGIEAQMIEGGSGNLNILENGAQKVVCNYRDPQWTDLKGFRGENDVESLFGEWNRLEVVCEGTGVEVRLNGQVVNRAVDLPASSGPIAIQSEEAEWFVRRLEVWPLGEFSEEWKPKAKSTNTGSGADLVARAQPWSTEKAIETFELDPDWVIELVASEPLVCDPVDVVWDLGAKRGSPMYVAEMRDYPLPSSHGKLLSRIRLVEDTDGDGEYDSATTWADHLDHVQGLLRVENSLIVTTRTAVLRLQDKDGDKVAETQEVLFTSNDPRHNQLQISSPRLGPDRWVYFNNGLDGKEIYPKAGDREEKVTIARRNIRMKAFSSVVEPVSGYGQFGQTIDDWGRRFSSSNRSPIMFSVMPLFAVERNPFAGITQGHIDIAPAGGDSLVYPLNLSHTTAAAHLGTHTAACGLSVYQDDIFVCEPTGQLVTRNKISPDGASLKAEHLRYAPQSEFLRSPDTWFRPVNLRPGPGGLYVCDMYRRFIDHARFFPEDFAKDHYLRAGFDHGRIWRIRAKNPPANVSETEDLSSLWKDTSEETVLAALEPDANPGLLENGLLVAIDWLGKSASIRERVFALAEHENARVRFMAVIALGELDGEDATKSLINASIRDVADPWVRKAVLSGAETRAGLILEAVIQDQAFAKEVNDGKLAFVREFSKAIGRRKEKVEVAALQEALESMPSWVQLAALEGLGKSATLSQEEWAERAAIAVDAKEPLANRLAAIPLARYLSPEPAVELLGQLLVPGQQPQIRDAAFAIASSLNRERVSTLLFSRWAKLDRESKAKALGILAKSAQMPLLEKMKAGDINPALLDPMSRWVFLRSKNEALKSLAEELYAQPSGDRDQVLKAYASAEELRADAKKGHEIFSLICATCHQFKGEGNTIGPDITDVRNKPWQGLLSDILDPNRAMEARWSAYSISLLDGRTLFGLITAETAAAVTIKGPGVAEEIPRSEIRSMVEIGQSLMPVGLEGSINQQQMADLIAFLQGKGKG